MSFQDIKGQDKVIQMLREQIRHFRLDKGYLFVGPEGTGKRLAAKMLAKTVNCQQQQADSCDKCVSCLKIENNQHPDVRWVDLEGGADSQGHIKIEYIRQLQKAINFKPYEARKKVFIINHAHALTAEASNALLKILEEPPENSLIILISAKPTLIFKTVISRCRVLKFYPLPRSRLEEVLRKDYSLREEQAHFLAYFCEGRLGEALRLKNTDIMKDKNGIIDQFVISKRKGLDTFLTKDRQRIRVCLNILAGWFRDIYLVKTGLPHQGLINLDRKAEILKFSKISFLDLDDIINSISDSLLYLEQNINVRLLLSNLRAHLWKE